jgi:hypothetical protein
MLWFNWSNIIACVDKDCKKVVKYFYNATKGLPMGTYDLVKADTPSSGKRDWILNPEEVVSLRKISVMDKCLYYYLASKRSYLTYQTTGDVSVPRCLVENISIQVLESNPLITLTPTKILLKYEEKHNVN